MLGIVAKGLAGIAVTVACFWVTLAIIDPVPPKQASITRTEQASDKSSDPDPTLPVGWKQWNERLYLAVNPDVAQAIARGDFRSARQHYELHGAAERRQGAFVPDNWNEAEYLSLHADVVAAVKAGMFISGYHHYLAAGRREGRPGGFPATTTAKK
jgi:hypothetical protein